MRAPDCTDHGRQVFDLARGLLDDAAAEAAEDHRRSCPACRAWWQSELEARTEVSAAVSQAFAAFRPPSRLILRPWLAAAAAVLVVVMGSVVWQLATRPPWQQRAGVRERIFVNGLEPDDLSTWYVEPGNSTSAVQPAAVVKAEGSLFDSDLESGDLSSWVVVSGSVKQAADRDAGPTLFTDDLESGDISSWKS